MLLTRTLLQRATRRLAARSFAGIEKTLDGKRSTEEERFIREQEKANKAKRDENVKEITTVGVVGLGLMGHGIAQISAAAGFQTVGVDLNSEVLANGQKAIEASVAKLNSRKASKNPDFDAPAATEETLARLSYASSVDAVAQCDLIVEAIVEDAAVKEKFYADLGERAKPEAIFASNTSSLAVAPMAAASKRPDRFVGLHYFNPVQLCVEIIASSSTPARRRGDAGSSPLDGASTADSLVDFHTGPAHEAVRGRGDARSRRVRRGARGRLGQAHGQGYGAVQGHAGLYCEPVVGA